MLQKRKIWIFKEGLIMKKSFLLLAFFFITAIIYSQDSGDYKIVTVKSGENLNVISRRYLKSSRFKTDLLRYNHISARQIKPGLKLKIPYRISKDRAAKVKFFKGKVNRKVLGSDWRPIRQIGTVLLQNDRIKTGRNAKVEIQFDDGSRIQLLSNSTIYLKEYSYSRKRRRANINLKNGSLFADVTKLGRYSSFKVTSITATVGVRGTQFYVSIDDQEKVKVELYKGKVVVEANNKKVALKAGQETVILLGQAPIKPRPIRSPRKIEWNK